MAKRAPKRDGAEAAALAREREGLGEVAPRLFVGERRKRARALKDEGFPEAARALGAERKPSPSVWALNRLARREDPSLQALLQGAERVRATQRRAVSGGGADDLREAQRALQDTVAAALKAAVRTLREAKESSSAQVQARMRDTLLAAATGGDEFRKALREGTLEEDVSAAGFGFVSPLQVLSRGGAHMAHEREREKERAEEAVSQAEKRATMLERFAEVAEARAREARQRADEASQALREGQEKLAALRRELRRPGR